MINSILALLQLFFLLLLAAAAFSADRMNKISVAVFPFNDTSSNSLDMNIPHVLQAELSGYDFIETVQVEVIRKIIYEIEPSLLWTGKEKSGKEGGILWKIEPEIVEQASKETDTQFSICGDLNRFGERWIIDVFIIKDGDSRPYKTFKISGLNNEDIPLKLGDISKNISDLLRKEYLLNEAEEDIRQYLGGMYSYSAVLEKMKDHINLAQESIPLRALRLDLYLKEKDTHQEDIINEGLKIIDLMEHSGDEDARYLLSLALDPFDTVAGIYEEKRIWEDAIAVRNKALRLFPYNSELHKEGIGRSHYLIARSFEEKGLREKAVVSYKTALTYLQPSSVYFKQAMEGIERLKGRGATGNVMERKI